MIEHKDIQHKIALACNGLTAENVYSQLTYFLIDIATCKENPCEKAGELAKIIGLLSDSYFGIRATQVLKKKEN